MKNFSPPIKTAQLGGFLFFFFQKLDNSTQKCYNLKDLPFGKNRTFGGTVMLITDKFVFHLESEDITLTLEEPASIRMCVGRG